MTRTQPRAIASPAASASSPKRAASCGWRCGQPGWRSASQSAKVCDHCATSGLSASKWNWKP